MRSRRQFLKNAGIVVGGMLLSAKHILAGALATPASDAPADYTLHIKASPVEIAPKRIVSAVTYNGQFPGPLLRFKEGRLVTIDVFNHTDTPEQLHWHGQQVPVEVDGAAEEGTPFIPAQGQRRIVFTPRPAGFRFYHTHNRAGADLSAGQYSGQVGPVYIEPKENPGRYDREIFLVLKEFEPAFSQGGDMAQDFLPLAGTVKSLKDAGESAMNASLGKGMPHGYEVGYNAFTINGRMLGHGTPIRVKRGQRVLFHTLNGSATEIRSRALPGHSFEVVALDGNPVPNPAKVPVLWLGTQFRWDYTRFAKLSVTAPAPDETFEMLFAKDNAAEEGFNRWTINGSSFPMSSGVAPASYHLHEGKRYRIRMRNASDDIHPIHLHRHSFELTRLGGKPTAGILKDVVMLGGYQEAKIDFVADNPGPPFSTATSNCIWTSAS